MSRILWLSNAPWCGSGYGEQTGMFVPRLAGLGHEMAVATNYGLQGAALPWNNILCYPSDGDWGNPTLATYAQHHQADQVIVLGDAWVMKPDAWPDLDVAIWAPIDHYPVPPPVLAILAHDRVRPIAMSKFGHRLLQEAGLEPLYVPHGVDRTVFRPIPGKREQVRQELGISEDTFLVGMVAANKGNPSLPRKAFPQALHAFARFAADRPDTMLYVHTDSEAVPGSGIPLNRLAQAVGCPEDRVCFPSPKVWHLGLSNTVVAALYQAFDVLLAPSMGEGFGIPILEAQACGVPVITSNHSAMSELGEAGWLVTGDPWWDALQDSFLIVPAIDSIVAALEAAYDSRGDTRLHAAAVEFAAGYDADHVTTQHWLPTLEALAAPREAAPLEQPVKA